MSVTLPNGAPAYLPDVPASLKAEAPGVYEYLVKLRREMGKAVGGLRDNDLAIVEVINAGTSGTFPLTATSFVFSNGILTSTV